jgi:hypothetical protein
VVLGVEWEAWCCFCGRRETRHVLLCRYERGYECLPIYINFGRAVRLVARFLIFAVVWAAAVTCLHGFTVADAGSGGLCPYGPDIFCGACAGGAGGHPLVSSGPCGVRQRPLGQKVMGSV